MGVPHQAPKSAPSRHPIPHSAPQGAGVPQTVPLRLQKFLARSGVASRRGSEHLMSAGRVQVNGQVVRELGSKVDPLRDEVRVDGKLVTWASEPFHLILHKPAGYLSTMHDPRERPCVAELVPTGEHPGLFCVGRLDKDTTGLLFFTTDGDLAQVLLHPSEQKPKRYLALVEGRVGQKALGALGNGIVLKDGLTAPARARRLNLEDARVTRAFGTGPFQGASVVELTLHEGKKHQVKRMLKAVGHPVRALHREAFGPLELGSLLPGEWRSLTKGELKALRAIKPSTSLAPYPSTGSLE